MNPLKLELEVEKMARALMTRNSHIGKDLIDHLRTQLSTEAVAGLLLISIERLIWSDTDSVFWAIEHVIPADVMQEIRRITSMAVYKRLISKGFMPGRDFSVDADGKLLLNDKAKKTVVPTHSLDGYETVKGTLLSWQPESY